MPRIPVTKTPKVYVGGQFIRSESGRVFPIHKPTRKGDTALLGNIPQCTRKDLRNAVEAAAKAGPDWAHRTPYNRGQIIYRLAEMLESRSSEMAESLVISGAATKAAAAEVSRGASIVLIYLRRLVGQIRAGARQYQSGCGSILQLHRCGADGNRRHHRR